MTEQNFTLEGADGHRIATRSWANDYGSSGSVQICHGLGEHCARYSRLAEALVDKGFRVVAHDHRGHGPSCPDSELGNYADANGWDKVVGDVQVVRDWVREQNWSGPHVLLGHSMGSYIAQSYAMRHPAELDRLVLSGSTSMRPAEAWIFRCIAWLEKLRLGARGKSALLEKMSFGSFNKAFEPARTAFDWLSRDAAEVDKYVNDPYCGFRATNQLWLDLIAGLLEISRKNALKRLPEVPILIIGGAADPISRRGKLAILAARMQAAGLGQVTLSTYDEARHEIFNETNRAQITTELLDWLGMAQ